MSQLMDFLIENPVDNVTDKVVISDRFPKGSFFEIRAIGSKEFFELQTNATKFKKGKKVEFDTKRFHEALAINYTVEPNFKNADFIHKAGCQTPEQLLNKVLKVGEISELAQKITSLSGFDQDLEDYVEEAKNS